MLCRFALFAFFCITAGYCAPEKGGEFRGGGGRNEESHSTHEGQHSITMIGTGSSPQSHNEGNPSDSRRNHEHQGIGTPEYNSAGSSKGSGIRPDNKGEHSSRPITGQSNNRENNHQPAGESLHNRPGAPSHRPQESFPTHGEGNNRPVGGNEHSSGRPSGGSFQSNEKGQMTGRPAGGSSHTTDHLAGGARPTGSRPEGGEHSFGQPTGGMSATSNHNKGNKRPEGSRPSNEMSHSGRPVEESAHGEQDGGHGGQAGQPSEANQQSGAVNKEQTENDKDDGKEEDKDVCFPNLGCFKMGKPWKSILRPIGPPYGPEKIQTTIHFYSRANLEKQKNITVYPEINMGQAQFDPSKITAIIVHGFSNSGNATWMKDMKNVYLHKVDANVLIVDWGKGAQLLNYLQVAGNTRVVGKQLGLFVKYLKENYGADPGKFHLIGHSLGAQICSYLAKEVPGIARLTALDPAQPGFEGFGSELRLDKTDAEFVDVIHTDARPFIPTLGFGMIAPHGHVDFYMNGGFDQPGCIPPPKKELPTIKNFLDLAKYPVEVISKTVACPHGRAYEYLIESFNETEKCIFWGHKADVKNVFKSVTNTVTQGLLKKFTALSPTCSKEDCIPVGFATKKSPLRGVFVVTTANRSPYCISEPGIPPETPPQERKQDSFIQKIGKKTGLTG